MQLPRQHTVDPDFEQRDTGVDKIRYHWANVKQEMVFAFLEEATRLMIENRIYLQLDETRKIVFEFWV